MDLFSWRTAWFLVYYGFKVAPTGLENEKLSKVGCGNVYLSFLTFPLMWRDGC